MAPGTCIGPARIGVLLDPGEAEELGEVLWSGKGLAGTELLADDVWGCGVAAECLSSGQNMRNTP